MKKSKHIHISTVKILKIDILDRSQVLLLISISNSLTLSRIDRSLRHHMIPSVLEQKFVPFVSGLCVHSSSFRGISLFGLCVSRLLNIHGIDVCKSSMWESVHVCSAECNSVSNLIE